MFSKIKTFLTNRTKSSSNDKSESSKKPDFTSKDLSAITEKFKKLQDLLLVCRTEVSTNSKLNFLLKDQGDIKEKLKKLKDLLLEYQIERQLVSNNLNYLETGLCLQTTHPEIFFSSKTFKNFKILKLLKNNSFGKVISVKNFKSNLFF